MMKIMKRNNFGFFLFLLLVFLFADNANAMEDNNKIWLPASNVNYSANEISNNDEILTHITSIKELTPVNTEDSHKNYWKNSRLELNYREQFKINSSDLQNKINIYPRVKKIENYNKYILFYQNGQIGSKINYTISNDSTLSTWSYPQVLFDKTKMSVSEKKISSKQTYKYYTTCDAVVLNDGKTILAISSFRPGKIGNYSLLDNKRYDLLNKYSGIDLRYSNDGGQTWSQPQKIYTGYNWEPTLNVINDEIVQVYFSQVAISMEHTGIEHSSGIGQFTLTKSVNGWTSDSQTESNWNFSATKTVFKFPAKNITTGKSVLVMGKDGKKHTRMTGQMPSVINLNNGTTMIAAETVYQESTKDAYMISFAYNDNPYFSNIGIGKSGPTDKKVYNFKGAAPYLGQFKSGEVVIGYNINGTYRLKLANTTGRKISKYVYLPLPKASSSFWGTLEVDNNSVISAIHGTTTGNDSDIYLSKSYLNHAVKLVNQTINVDGNCNEWTNQDALFIGDKSQAQSIYRFAVDKDYLYISSEVLDDTIISPRDTQLIYFGTSASDYYKIHIGSNGLLKAVHTNKGRETEVDSIIVKSQILSSVNQNDTGYVNEIAVPLSLLKNNLKDLRVNPILFNSDNPNKPAKKDIIDYTNSRDFDTWIPVIY